MAGMVEGTGAAPAQNYMTRSDFDAWVAKQGSLQQKPATSNSAIYTPSYGQMQQSYSPLQSWAPQQSMGVGMQSPFGFMGGYGGGYGMQTPFSMYGQQMDMGYGGYGMQSPFGYGQQMGGYGGGYGMQTPFSGYRQPMYGGYSPYGMQMRGGYFGYGRPAPQVTQQQWDPGVPGAGVTQSSLNV